MLLSPKSKIGNRKSKISSDDFVRPGQHVRGNCEADLFSCLQIDDELELHRLLDRKIRWLNTFENLIDVSRCAPVNISEIDPISHESAVLGKLPRIIHCRQAKFAGEFGNPR